MAPWTEKDATRHTKKATSGKSKRQWSEVANKELASGKSEGDAVRIANGVVKAHHGNSKERGR